MGLTQCFTHLRSFPGPLSHRAGATPAFPHLDRGAMAAAVVPTPCLESQALEHVPGGDVQQLVADHGLWIMKRSGRSGPNASDVIVFTKLERKSRERTATAGTGPFSQEFPLSRGISQARLCAS